MSRPSSTDAVLIEIETMLHDARSRVGRAVTNLQQEVGGFGSKTPGSGDPPGGHGGGATIAIARPSSEPVPVPQFLNARRAAFADDVERWHRRPLSSVDHVPVTSVEVQALGFAGIDEAAVALDELLTVASTTARVLGATCAAAGLEVPTLTRADSVPRLVVIGYARARRLHLATVDISAGLRDAMPSVARMFNLCQRWGYTPGRPTVAKDRADMLAHDPTDQLCTSHLRVGARRDRDRGELCQWCRKFEYAEGFVPPRELVQIHVDQGRVYDHQIAPFRQAHRDRQRRKAGAR